MANVSSYLEPAVAASPEAALRMPSMVRANPSAYE
jgi:hypothetical protein